VFVNNGNKVNSIPPTFQYMCAPVRQVLTNCSTPVVKGGQPCYTETEWPSTIVDKGKLKYEGPSQATDNETT